METNKQLGQPTASRRDFLKASAAATATVGGLSLTRSAHAQGSDVIKIGMIGSGNRCAGAAAQAMSAGPDVQLVAMCDVFEKRVNASRRALLKRHSKQMDVPDERCFVGFDGHQKVIDASDVVLIACASKFHPMYSEAAIKAGKHVFVEKPHAIDPVGIRRMQAVCDLAKEKGLSLVSGLHSRFDPAFRETVKRIHDGAIGEIVSMQSMFLRSPYRVYRRDPKLTETQYQFSNWYHFCWLSGDDVTQSLVHDIDRVSWILKEEMPTWAFGLGGRSSSFGEEFGDMFDHNTVVYEYESGPRLYAMCRTQYGCYDNFAEIIMGSKGTAHMGRRCQIDGETKWRFRGRRGNAHAAEQVALIKAVRSGEPLNSGNYMIGSTMAAILGQIASYTGRATKFADAQKADLQFGPTPEESNFDIEPPVKLQEDGNYPLPMPGVTKLI